MKTLIDLFVSFLPRRGETACIHRTGIRRFAFSYQELHDLSLRMNGWLASQGVGKGDRVLLWGPNSPWWGVAFWGISTRGAIAVPVDFMSGPDRAGTIAGLTDAKLVIQSRDKLDRLADRQSVLMEDLPYLLAVVEPLTEINNPKPGDVAELIYTSGTTGNPKGVILTHRNLVANILQVNRHIPVVTGEFNFLSLLPLSHMFEQMGGFFIPLYNGATITYIRTLKPSAIMEALEEEDIYAIIAVPRLLQLLKNSIERELEMKHFLSFFRQLMLLGEKLSKTQRRLLFYPVQKKFGSHFTLFVSGGAPLDPDVFRFWDSMGFTLLEGYGLTECSPVLTANSIERQIAGSVGPALPGVELKIRDGEILVRGDNIFPGYYENEKATLEAFTADGWFLTGDLGEIGPDGWLHIKGRSKDLIVTGAGVNVYPDEIEALLNRTPGVRESCVIGIDRGAGDEVHAVLLLDESGRGADEIIAEINGSLDELHRITSFTLWPESEFPKTTTMKIQKFKVKERVKQGVTGGEEGKAADRLAVLVARVTGMPAERVTDASSLVGDLGLTSIGRLELVNGLEQEFRLDLEDSAITPNTKVGDIREMIRKREKVAVREHFRFWATRPPFMALRRFFDFCLHYPIIRHFATLEVEGLDNLNIAKEAVMFVSNHLSYFDHPAIMFAMPPKWRYNTATAAWEEFFFRNFRNFAQMLWKRLAFEYTTIAFTVFPLPQSGGFRGSLRYMGKLADHRINILVFPEGERSRDGSLLPFQQGLGIMVKNLGMPVVPVKISGLEKVFPRGAGWPKKGTVKVSFGKPLHFTLQSPAEIVEITRKAIQDL